MIRTAIELATAENIFTFKYKISKDPRIVKNENPVIFFYNVSCVEIFSQFLTKFDPETIQMILLTWVQSSYPQSIERLP